MDSRGLLMEMRILIHLRKDMFNVLIFKQNLHVFDQCGSARQNDILFQEISTMSTRLRPHQAQASQDRTED